MAAVIGSTQIQIKKIGSPTTVPHDPIAKLMYYFNCICSCVEADNDNTFRRLRDFKNYSSLSSQEEAQLLILCLALSPDKLIGTILFPASDNEDFDGSSNRFFELSAVSTRVLVSESLLVGGQQRKIRKIMKFKKSWIESNYINPLCAIERGHRPTASYSSRPAALPSPPRHRPPPQSAIERGQRPTATSRPAVLPSPPRHRPPPQSASERGQRPTATSRPVLPSPPRRRQPPQRRSNNTSCTILWLHDSVLTAWYAYYHTCTCT